MGRALIKLTFSAFRIGAYSRWAPIRGCSPELLSDQLNAEWEVGFQRYFQTFIQCWRERIQQLPLK